MSVSKKPILDVRSELLEKYFFKKILGVDKIPNKKDHNIEGYWYSKSEPQYPHPIANKDKWEGQDKFANQLINTQFKASKTNYKGWSDCRVCNKMNGSSEFQLDNWKWPEGLLHYIVNHNVKPSQEFIDFINEQ